MPALLAEAEPEKVNVGLPQWYPSFVLLAVEVAANGVVTVAVEAACAAAVSDFLVVVVVDDEVEVVEEDVDVVVVSFFTSGFEVVVTVLIAASSLLEDELGHTDTVSAQIITKITPNITNAVIFSLSKFSRLIMMTFRPIS